MALRAAGGELARHAYANVDAAELYERALEVSRRVPGVTDADRPSCGRSSASCGSSPGVLDGSVDAYRRAAGLTADPVARAEVLARRARVHERAGSPAAALRLITRARHLLETVPGPSAIPARVRLDTLVAAFGLGRRGIWMRDVGHCGRRKPRAINDPVNLARALIFADYADVLLGTSGVGERTREAMEISIAQGDAVTEQKARANLGGYAFYAGRWEEAVDWYRSSREVALKLGKVFKAAEIDLALGEILVHQGRADEAEGVLRDAIRVLRASNDVHSAAYGEMLLARVHLVQGDFRAGDELAARVVAAFTLLGNPISALEAASFEPPSRWRITGPTTHSCRS